jgi:hypothetical protein
MNSAISQPEYNIWSAAAEHSGDAALDEAVFASIINEI